MGYRRKKELDKFYESMLSPLEEIGEEAKWELRRNHHIIQSGNPIAIISCIIIYSLIFYLAYCFFFG